MDAADSLLEESWQWAKPRIEARINHLKSLFEMLDEKKDEVRRELHRLGGTLGCFGLSEASALAQNIETRFLNKEPSASLVGHLERLRVMVAEGPKRATSPLAKVAIFSEPDIPLTDLMILGDERQIMITPLDELSSLVGKTWDAVILDTEHPCSLIFPSELNIPTLGLVKENDHNSRLCASKAGAKTTCSRDGQPKIVLQALKGVLEQTKPLS